MIDLTTRQVLLDSEVPDLPSAQLEVALDKGLVLEVKQPDDGKSGGLRNLVLVQNDGEVAWQQPEPADRIKAMAVHPNKRMVAFGLEDGKVQVLELAGSNDAPVMRWLTPCAAATRRLFR